MQSRVPTLLSEEADNSDDETTPEESVSDDGSSDDAESLDEIIDAYAECV